MRGLIDDFGKYLEWVVVSLEKGNVNYPLCLLIPHGGLVVELLGVRAASVEDDLIVAPDGCDSGNVPGIIGNGIREKTG